MKSNVILNKTLEQYNKKYRNLSYNLIKISKKQVEDFDKKNHTKYKNFLLKDKYWCLINDTYYEIPKPIRWTWFRNLNAAAQIGTCVLGLGAVTTAVVVPTYLLTSNKEGILPIIEGDATVDKTKTHIELNKESTIVLILEEGKKIDVENIEVTVGGNKLEKDKDYEVDDILHTIKIKAEAMTSTEVKIKVSTITQSGEERFLSEYKPYSDIFENARTGYSANQIKLKEEGVEVTVDYTDYILQGTTPETRYAFLHYVSASSNDLRCDYTVSAGALHNYDYLGKLIKQYKESYGATFKYLPAGEDFVVGLEVTIPALSKTFNFKYNKYGYATEFVFEPDAGTGIIGYTAEYTGEPEDGNISLEKDKMVISKSVECDVNKITITGGGNIDYVTLSCPKDPQKTYISYYVDAYYRNIVISPKKVTSEPLTITASLPSGKSASFTVTVTE